MKKTALLAVIAAVALMFGACQKEGKFNPKEKIAKVYTESSTIYNISYGGLSYNDTLVDPKELAEEWTWDGKELTKITFIDWDEDDQGNRIPDNTVVNFKYDGGLLVELNDDNGSRVVLTYDGKMLQKAEMYVKGEQTPSTTLTYTINDKKIVGMTTTATTDDIATVAKNGSVKCSHLFDMLTKITTPSAEAIQLHMAKACDKARKNGAKGVRVTSYEFTWSGNNISKVASTSDGETITYEYTFDDKKNPLKSFYASMLINSEACANSFDFGNENNITKEVYTYSYTDALNIEHSDSSEANLSYTYDGDWPVVRTKTFSMKEGEIHIYNSTTTYFEYK